MNREDTIRIAQEAGLHIATDVNWMPVIGLEYAVKFAELVASAEREACARVCDDIHAKYKWPQDTAEKVASQWCADAIRARGQA